VTDGRIIEVHERPARVRLDTGRLVIESEISGKEPVYAEIAASDVAALILAHPQIAISGAALAAVAEAGGIVVIGGGDALPRAMLLPFGGHHAPTRRMAAQLGSSLPTRKRLWAEIVRAKIAGQASILRRQNLDTAVMETLANTVRSGDPDNCEAQAARYYWSRLWGEDFVRDRDAQDQNRLLNYGYAILRAIVARSLCGAGLHPGAALHHHHRNNPFPLADDLMEFLRPVVDSEVVALVAAAGPNQPMDAPLRRRLATILAKDGFRFGRETWVPATLALQVAQRLGRVFEGERDSLGLEKLWDE
jgi:CRISPR-associated endonuclease Cas1